jgi:hypothetical protein
MKGDKKIVSNIVVGEPEVDRSAPSHVRGVSQANESKGDARGSARRSTGIRPSGHEVIDPRMPKLSPA